VQMNLILRDGGNLFTGYFHSELSGHQLSGDNLTDDLRARGLQSGTEVLKVFDVNGALGGPIRSDKLWFYSAHRRWGGTYRWANQFHSIDPTSPVYRPDLSRPSDTPEKHWSNNVRLTYQASDKTRLTFFADKQVARQPFNSTQSVGLAAPEAISGVATTSNAVIQGTWSYQASNRLYIDGGWNFTRLAFVPTNTYGTWPDAASVTLPISILEQSTNYRYRSPATYIPQQPGQTNQRLTVSYLRGAHTLKAGLFLMENTGIVDTFTHPSGLSYTFQNGVPIQLTQYATPFSVATAMRPELGLYAQDQWKVGRLSLNLGLRFDYLRIYDPANEQPANPFMGIRRFDRVDCVPCWKDLNPRAAASYDLFGNG
jgi:hypothetical protein